MLVSLALSGSISELISRIDDGMTDFNNEVNNSLLDPDYLTSGQKLLAVLLIIVVLILVLVGWEYIRKHFIKGKKK
jgi:hypothetical protein